MKYMKQSMKHILAGVLLLFFGFSAFAQNKFLQDLSAAKKSEAKSKSRWTLEGWLAQKERNQMMDLWLAMNQASPYEASLTLTNVHGTQNYLQGTGTAMESTVESTSSSLATQLSVYSHFVGLEGTYHKNEAEQNSMSSLSLNLRVLGNSLQSTHLILGFGQRVENAAENGTAQEPDPLRQTYYKASLNVFLLKSLGVFGEYHNWIPTEHQSLNQVSGYYQEVGVFIDYSFIRIYGSTFVNEKNWTTLDSGTQEESKSQKKTNGIRTGILFYF